MAVTDMEQPVYDKDGFVGSILIIPSVFDMPPIYYGIKAYTHEATEFYLTAEDAVTALQEERWSFETRRVLSETE